MLINLDVPPKYTMDGLEVQDKMNGNGTLHTRE